MSLAQLVALVISLLGRGDGGQAWNEVGAWLDRSPRDRDEPAMKFVLELLALARCEPAAAPGAWADGDPQSPWRVARAHLELERLRLARRVPPWAERLRWDPPGEPEAAAAIVWPPGEERWPGEAPRVAPTASRCGPRDAQAGAGPEADALTELLGWLPAGAPTRAALTLELAFLRFAAGEAAQAEKLLARFDTPGGLDDLELLPEERRERHVLAARVAHALGRGRAELWLRARGGSGAEYVDAHLVASALAEGDRDALVRARAVAEERAASSDWFLVRAALIALRLGDEARFFALGRQLLGKKTRAQVQAQRDARELFELEARWIARQRFGDVTLELVEALGPPAQLRDRLEAIAQLGLRAEPGQGDPEAARARAAFAAGAYRWLIPRAKSPAAVPRLQGRLALAVLASGQAPEFCPAYQALATGVGGDRPELEAERQLLFTTRDALPLLDGAPELAGCMVRALQPILREEGRGRVRGELTELYRVLSAQLPLGARPKPPAPGPTVDARAYAEKLGAERAPVVLGELRIAAAGAASPPPADLPPPHLRGASSLLCLPEGARGCRRWAGPPRSQP